MPSLSLRDRFEVLSDEQLLEVVGKERTTYTAEALQVAESVLASRGVSLPRTSDAGQGSAETTSPTDSNSRVTSGGTAYDYVTNALVIIIWGIFAYGILSFLLPGLVRGPFEWFWSIFYAVSAITALPLAVAWVILRVARGKKQAVQEPAE